MKRALVAAMLFLIAFAAAADEKKPYTRNVAIVVYENAEPLDWTGPFEVYNDAGSFGNITGEDAFHVYIVSKTTEPINAQGLKVVPNYSIENAPKPDIVVFPGGPANKLINDPAFFAWAKKAASEAEIAQSVCTGAFVLAKAGLLDNLEVTTWYGAIDRLRESYPKITVKDGRRFVDNDRIVTTAGISAGIDGSLHVVARLLGRRVADQVARYMEYHWTPEAYLATRYAYLNPSTDARGRTIQSGDMLHEEKNFTEAANTYRGLIKEDPRYGAAWYRLAQTLRATNDHLGAAQAYVKAADSMNKDSVMRAYYNAACEFALADHLDESVQFLQKAFDAGFKDRDAINRDPDLAKLRNDPRARQIAEVK